MSRRSGTSTASQIPPDQTDRLDFLARGEFPSDDEDEATQIRVSLTGNKKHFTPVPEAVVRRGYNPELQFLDPSKQSRIPTSRSGATTTPTTPASPGGVSSAAQPVHGASGPSCPPAPSDRAPPPTDSTINDFFSDLVDAETQHVPVPVPGHEMRMRQQRERFERDGITDLQAAISNCKLCAQGIRIFDGSEDESCGVTEERTFVNMYADGIATSSPDTIFRKMADYWNKHLHDAFKPLGYVSIPRLTPSEVEVHFHHCDKTNPVPALIDDVNVGEDLSHHLLENSILVEQYVAGRPTGRVQLTQNGIKWYLETRKFRRESFALLSSTLMELRSTRNRPHFLLPGATISRKKMTYKEGRRLAAERGSASSTQKTSSGQPNRDETKSY